MHRLRLASCAALLSLSACTSLVTPPQRVDDPVTVFLLGEALHLGLLMPTDDGYVEYGFGEWAWYAQGRTAWYRTIPVMLWPTAATLAQRSWPGCDAAGLRDRAARSGVRLEQFVVDRRALATLQDRLSAWFEAGRDLLVEQPAWRMRFVPLDEEGTYWFGNNCSDALARWLEELDCTVTPTLIRGDLRVRQE